MTNVLCYTLILKRSPVVDAGGGYTRWDDYSGGDPNWRGGEISIYKICEGQRSFVGWAHSDLEKNVSKEGMNPAIILHILDWCTRHLPTGIESVEYSAGWSVEFKIKEGGEGWNNKREIEPVLNQEAKEVMAYHCARRIISSPYSDAEKMEQRNKK